MLYTGMLDQEFTAHNFASGRIHSFPFVSGMTQ